MITDISIRKLRGIKECEIHNLDKINLFIGKNSSGKSTILESIQILTSVIFFPPGKISSIVHRRSDRSWHPQELWYRYEDKSKLSITLSFNNKNNLCVTAYQESKDSKNVGFYMSGTTIEKPIRFREVTRDTINRAREQAERGGQVSFSPDKKQIGKLNLSNEISDFLEGITLIDPIGKLRTSELENELQNIKFAGKYEDTLRALRQIYDEKMQNWELFPYFSRSSDQNRTAFRYEGGRPIYVDNLGDGVKYGFATLTLAYNTDNSALLIEEIETHQHPYSLRMLIKFLIEIAKENNLQLFVSTQSPDVLRYFKTFHPGTKVFLIEKDPNEDVVHAHDEENLMTVFREVGWDFEDLLKYEKIAIVDGVEDQIIIEDFFQKIRGYSLDSEGIKLLLVRGGQKNFGQIVKTVLVSSRQAIIIKDLDEIKNRPEVMTLVLSWFRSLENEGWKVQENDQQVIGEHISSRKKWKILKSKILTAGNPERFPEYKKHSITDYVLEVILDHPEITSKFALKAEVSGYQLEANSSKEELGFLLESYNMDMLKQIVQATKKDMIPSSIKNDILMVI